jgi:hypothetical protein
MGSQRSGNAELIPLVEPVTMAVLPFNISDHLPYAAFTYPISKVAVNQESCIATTASISLNVNFFPLAIQ